MAVLINLDGSLHDEPGSLTLARALSRGRDRSQASLPLRLSAGRARLSSCRAPRRRAVTAGRIKVCHPTTPATPLWPASPRQSPRSPPRPRSATASRAARCACALTSAFETVDVTADLPHFECPVFSIGSSGGYGEQVQMLMNTVADGRLIPVDGPEFSAPVASAYPLYGPVPAAPTSTSALSRSSFRVGSSAAMKAPNPRPTSVTSVSSRRSSILEMSTARSHGSRAQSGRSDSP